MDADAVAIFHQFITIFAIVGEWGLREIVAVGAVIVMLVGVFGVGFVLIRRFFRRLAGCV